MAHRVLAVTSAIVLGIAVGCGGGASSVRLHILLEPQAASSTQSADLDQVTAILRKRIAAFGFKAGTVQTQNGTQVAIELSRDVDQQTAVADLTRVGLLEFCEPVVDGSGDIALVQQGKVQYLAGSCEPQRDAQGNVVVNGGSISYQPWTDNLSGLNINRDDIVWQPAKGNLNGTPTALTGRFLNTTSAVPNPDPVNAITYLLTFEMNGDGAAISGSVTRRLSQRKLPLAVFLDGMPITGDNNHIIAPTVQSVITSRGEITGLSQAEAKHLTGLLNAGALPVVLRVVSVGLEGGSK